MNNQDRKELIENIRWWAEGQDAKVWYTKTMRAAAFELECQADEIESLTATNELLREALKEAMLHIQFPDLFNKWDRLLKEAE